MFVIGSMPLHFFRLALIVFVLLFGPVISEIQAQDHQVIPFEVDGEVMDQDIIYDNSGRPYRVTHYALRSRKLTEAELFFHQLENSDSTITYADELAVDRYTWDNEGQLLHIRRWAGRRGSNYLFGPDQQLSMRRIERDRLGRVGERHREFFSVHNAGNEPLSLSFVDLPEHVRAERSDWTIHPGDTLEVAVKVTILPGEHRSTVLLDHGHGKIPLTIASYGYHVRTDDLLSDVGLLCPSRMIYYRTGGETLIEVTDPISGEILVRYPIHSDRTLIDLGSISMREFEFCARDYGSGSISCTSVAVE